MADVMSVLRKALAGDVKSIAITAAAAGSVGALYVCVRCRASPGATHPRATNPSSKPPSHKGAYLFRFSGRLLGALNRAALSGNRAGTANSPIGLVARRRLHAHARPARNPIPCPTGPYPIPSRQEPLLPPACTTAHVTSTSHIGFRLLPPPRLVSPFDLWSIPLPSSLPVGASLSAHQHVHRSMQVPPAAAAANGLGS